MPKISLMKLVSKVSRQCFPSFSSSKLAASNTRKTGLPGLQKFRKPVRNTTKANKAKGRYSSSSMKKNAIKVSDYHLHQHRFSEKIVQQIIPGVIEKFNPQLQQRRKRRNHLKLSEIPTLANIQIGRKEYHLLVKQKCQ